VSEIMKNERAFALLFAAAPAGIDATLATFGAAIAALCIVLTALALALRMKALERRVSSLQTQISLKEKDTRGDFEQFRKSIRADLDELKTVMRKIPADIERLGSRLASQAKSAAREVTAAPPRQLATPVHSTHDFRVEPSSTEDAVGQLLSIANGVLRQSTAATLTEFRAATERLSMRASPWPDDSDGKPVAFIVEHRGSHYAVPNVVKPARLPNEWFNRSAFGFNDDIRHVVSLPRLRRRGDDYEVQEAGVFEK